jgi:hypothetical protein
VSVPPHARPLYQYAKLVGEKGTAQEKLDLANDIRVMRELREAFPGSSWEPMEHVVLISTLQHARTRGRSSTLGGDPPAVRLQGRSEASSSKRSRGTREGSSPSRSVSACLSASPARRKTPVSTATPVASTMPSRRSGTRSSTT